MSRPLPWLADALADIESQGLLRERREIKRLPGGRCEIDGRTVLNFTSNDYLDLAADPRVVAAARTALQEGVGARASALLGGRTEWHLRLEQRIADFEQQEAAILFPSGLAANLGTICALVGKDDILFSDRFNHASLIDGCRLSGAKIRIYRHDELDVLERELRQTEGFRRRWIVTDGVFSMDGDLAPLPALCDLAERYGAELIVDEAHATGVYGEHGRGAAEELGVEHRIAVRIGTLSKAVGCLGGFVAGSVELIAFLWNRARTQVFSTALPPAICAAAEASLAVIQSEPQRRQRLRDLSVHFRQQLGECGIECAPELAGPIVPIQIGEARTTMDIAGQLLERGFLVGGIRPPTVPHGTSRLRISLSLAHRKEEATQLAIAIAKAMI